MTFKEIMFVIFWVIIGSIAWLVIVLGLTAIIQTPERALFNKHFGTNYTAVQWVTSEKTIKDYIHAGENKRLNINIDK